ncbi:SAV_6107 family HEPN domain-containing protein [Streptomyces sp. NPDC088923]|uniref:SAV_6107 family HEPN domain-containing protein n=1 Tax=Streptomyces sp. NPDC088923 TaxID=3365913 RepID=UPI0038032AAE
MAHTPSGDAATPRPESDAPEQGSGTRVAGGGARGERGGARERPGVRREPPEQLRLPVPDQRAAVPAAPRTPRRVARQLAFPVTPAQPVRPGPRGAAARTVRPGERERAAATRAAGEGDAGRGGGAVPPTDAPSREAAHRPPVVIPRQPAPPDTGAAPTPLGPPAPPGTNALPIPPSTHTPPAPPATSAPPPASPASPGEDVHPVLRKAGAPPAARDLLDRAREELAVARSETGAERYAAAHRAALRAASAVLAVHGPPPGTRPRGRRGIRSAWETLAEAVPELAPWTLLFTASAAHRARAEAGLHDPASTGQADELLRAAEDFTQQATALLALPEPHATP